MKAAALLSSRMRCTTTPGAVRHHICHSLAFVPSSRGHEVWSRPSTGWCGTWASSAVLTQASRRARAFAKSYGRVARVRFIDALKARAADVLGDPRTTVAAWPMAAIDEVVE